MNLHIDIETRSSIDISSAGAYRYTESPDFEILLFAYKIDDQPTKVLEMDDIRIDRECQDWIRQVLADRAVKKYAYNAAFEWQCLNAAGFHTPIDQWYDTMAHAYYCGFSGTLEKVGDAIGLPQDKKKLSTGKALIRYFCTPAKATKANGGRPWNAPHHDTAKWELFKQYNAQDVEAEYAIEQRLSAFPMPEEEVEMWRLDTLMNARGVRCDRQLMEGALYLNAASNEALMQEAKEITHLNNPNSRDQILGWIGSVGYPLPDLTKDTVADALRSGLPDHVARVLQIRQQVGKTSVSKYEAMQASICDDDRIRGLTQYYGASRTGRYSGRIVQLQNLPRNYMKTLDIARRLVRDGNLEAVQAIYGNVQDTLSQLTRTAFIPSDGNKLVVADYAAIEARVVAWIAGETWVNEVFATHGKIYEATAAQMFGVPIETIAKGKENYDLRQKGKIAQLALGYQGGVNALVTMGALDMGIPEEELPDIVDRWRKANQRIVDLWREVEEAMIEVVESGAAKRVANGLIEIAVEGDLIYGLRFMTIKLPSGRKLYYNSPSLKENRFGKKAVHYLEIGKTGKWEETSTYGGRAVENCTQSIARDCLTHSLKAIARKGWNTVFHVHDEVVLDAPQEVSVDEVCALMSEPIPWAPGLLLKAAGFEAEYYQKD